MMEKYEECVGIRMLSGIGEKSSKRRRSNKCMRSNQGFKRIAALALSGVLALGAVPRAPLVQEAHADTDAAEPSAVAYADRTELEGIPTVDGNAYGGDVTKVGRIKLGKDASNKVMEWYILGSDPGVTGSNTAIFAASEMAIGQMFHTSVSSPYTIAYTADANMSYENNTPSYVLMNHYGMSELRDALQSLATSKFTSAEQGIMQATEVDTPDYKADDTRNSYTLTGAAPRAVYTTEDVLYAAWGDPRFDTESVASDTYAIGGDMEHIYIGSTAAKDDMENRTKVINLADLGASTWFWLRMVDADDDDLGALAAVSCVVHCSVDISLAVRPASNLNLSSVRFASAASATSSSTGAADTIKTTDDTSETKDAMMLRLDGADQNIGDVSADASSGIITATKGTTSGEVTLIVQGRNASTDWYYTKTITSTTGETVTLKDDIVPALTTAGVTLDGITVDLTKCKIWIETPVEPSETAEDRTLFYAVAAEATTHTHKAKDGYESDGPNHWQVCEICGAKMDIAAHSPSDWTPTEDKSQHTRDCDICHGADTVETENHTYDWKFDGTYHWKECTKCGYADPTYEKAAHDFDPTDGECHDCPYNMNTDHGLILVEAKAESCTADGNIEYYRCGKTGHESERFAENAETGMYVKVSEDDVIIKAHHTYDEDSDWKSNATYHWHVCSVCGEKIADTQATHSYSGRKCTVCGYTKSSSGGSGGGGGSNTGASGASSGASSGVSGTWHQDEKGWWFEYMDGSYAHGRLETNEDGTTTMYVAWVKTGGKWYAFDADGYMVKDWVYDAESGCWYYCDENYGMHFGWLYTPVDNCWYYLDPVNGKMHTAWSLIDGKYYYFSEMHNGTYYQDPATGKWIYLNLAALRPLGSMYAATLTPDGCLVGADGAYIPQ